MFAGKKCHHWKFLFFGIAEEKGNQRKTMLVKLRAWVCIRPSWQTVITMQVWFISFNLLEWTSLICFVCVLCNLKNEFFYWLYFIPLFLGLFEEPSHWMFGVSSWNTQISRTLRTVSNSLRTENCYHWGKSFPRLKQSEQRICGPWEVSKLYASK